MGAEIFLPFHVFGMQVTKKKINRSMSHAYFWPLLYFGKFTCIPYLPAIDVGLHIRRYSMKKKQHVPISLKLGHKVLRTGLGISSVETKLAGRTKAVDSRNVFSEYGCMRLHVCAPSYRR